VFLRDIDPLHENAFVIDDPKHCASSPFVLAGDNDYFVAFT
jgi:hypothetical protein